MKPYLSVRNCSANFTVPTILILAGASLLLVSSVVGWSSAGRQMTARHNQYFASVAAAEAAGEQVIAAISRDFQAGSEPAVFQNLSVYRQLVPTVGSLVNTLTNTLGNLLGGGSGQSSGGSNALTDFEFSDAQGHVNQTYADRLTTWAYAPLQTKLPGVSGNAANYRIVSNARQLNTPFNSTAAVRQDVQIASISLFEYQVFYAQDLEMCPGTAMTYTGPVHCNGTIYLQPNGFTETFLGPVTASSRIFHYKSPNDPTIRSAVSVIYNAG